MKKIVAFLLVAVILTLCSCSNAQKRIGLSATDADITSFLNKVLRYQEIEDAYITDIQSHIMATIHMKIKDYREQDVRVSFVPKGDSDRVEKIQISLWERNLENELRYDRALIRALEDYIGNTNESEKYLSDLSAVGKDVQKSSKANNNEYIVIASYDLSSNTYCLIKGRNKLNEWHILYEIYIQE